MRYTLFTNQTVKFPQTSIQGNKYQMILHKIYSKSTWVDAIKSCTKGEIIAACNRALTRKRICSLNPKHKILDNEASEKYKEAIRASGMTCQIIPPNNHRRNIADKAIQF